jgi:hypothetical protein
MFLLAVNYVIFHTEINLLPLSCRTRSYRARLKFGTHLNAHIDKGADSRSIRDFFNDILHAKI